MKTFQELFDVDQKLLKQEELILDATELLSTIMDENNISKADLARRLGKSKAFVTQCLSGGQNLTLRTLADLFSAVGYRLQLGATPGSREASKQMVRLYSIGGWAIERVTQSMALGNDCDEVAYLSQSPYLSEAA